MRVSLRKKEGLRAPGRHWTESDRVSEGSEDRRVHRSLRLQHVLWCEAGHAVERLGAGRCAGGLLLLVRQRQAEAARLAVGRVHGAGRRRREDLLVLLWLVQRCADARDAESRTGKHLIHVGGGWSVPGAAKCCYSAAGSVSFARRRRRRSPGPAHTEQRAKTERERARRRERVRRR